MNLRLSGRRFILLLLVSLMSACAAPVTAPAGVATGAPAPTPASGQMDNHGDAGEHEHAAAAGAPASGGALALVEALPIDALHDLDESLAQGAMPTNAQETMTALIEAIDATVWPDSIHARIDELRAAAEELQATLKTGDVQAASPLASKLHGIVHALEVTAPDH